MNYIDPTAAAAKKPAFITLIDPKKANNTAIMLTKYYSKFCNVNCIFNFSPFRYKMFTFAQIREAILSIDDSIVDEELAANLLRFAPVKEDVCCF